MQARNTVEAIKNTAEINANLILADLLPGTPLLRLSSDSHLLRAILRSMSISAIEEEILKENNIRFANERNRFEKLVVKPAQTVRRTLDDISNHETTKPAKKAAILALRPTFDLLNNNPFKQNETLLEQIKIQFKLISDLLAQLYQDSNQRPSVDEVLKEVEELNAESNLSPSAQPQAATQENEASYAIGTALAKSKLDARFKILSHANENNTFDELYLLTSILKQTMDAILSMNHHELRNLSQTIANTKQILMTYSNANAEDAQSIGFSLQGSALDFRNNTPKPAAGKATADEDEVAEQISRMGFNNQ